MRFRACAVVGAVVVLAAGVPAWASGAVGDDGPVTPAMVETIAELEDAPQPSPVAATPGAGLANQTDSQALAVAAEQDPALFASQPTGIIDPPAGARIEQYLDDFTARIDVAGQGPDVIATSTTPARVLHNGVNRPVDLKLVAAGSAIEPRTPVVPLSFARSLRSGITIAHNIRMRVVGADPAAYATVAGQEVFYSNALQDADVFATPLPAGLETFVQLRSRDSPTTITYQLDLPNGARLVERPRADAGIEIMHDSELLATIAAPVSEDANDQVVRTIMQIDGDRVVLHVAVADSTAFPVLVDPVVTDNQFAGGDAANANGSFANTLGWRRASSSGALGDFNWGPNADNTYSGASCYRIVNNQLGTWPGELCAGTQTGRFYTGQVGEWQWRPPGGTRSYLDDGPNMTFDGYVYRAYVRHAYTRLSTSNNAWMYSGIRSGRTGQWIGINGNVDQGGGVDDVRYGPWTFGENTITAISNPSFLREYCAATDCSVEHPTDSSYDGASFAFGIYAYGSGHSLSANALGAVFYQYDRTPPSVTVTAATDVTEWRSGGSVSTKVIGTDKGMGMLQVGVTHTDKNGATQTTLGGPYGCTGGVGHPCPPALAETFETDVADLPEGTDAKITGYAYDILGKRSDGNVVSVKIDRSAPTGTIATPPAAARGNATFSGTLADSLSGPGRWIAEVTSNGGSTWSQACSATQAAGDGTWSCSWNTDTAPEGTYQVRARLEDAVTPANGGANVSWVSPPEDVRIKPTIKIDRSAPGAITGATGYLNPQNSQVEIHWDLSTDPSLSDGSVGSGIAGYRYRYKRAGVDWSAWLTSDYPWVTLEQGVLAETIQLEVVATDVVGNESPSTSIALNVQNAPSTADCQPHDVGAYATSCATDAQRNAPADETDDAEGVHLTPISDATLRSTTTPPRRGYIIHVAAPSAAAAGSPVLYVPPDGKRWTTIRNSPGAYVLGQAHDGWTVYADQAANGQSSCCPAGTLQNWRRGVVYADDGPLKTPVDFGMGCGWIVLDNLDSGPDLDQLVNCNEHRFDLGRFSAVYNCPRTIPEGATARCAHGSATNIQTVGGTDLCADVGLQPDGTTHGCLYSVTNADGSQAHLARGKCVEWRYITSDNEWALVKIRGRSNPNASWVFVPRSALKPDAQLPNILTRGAGHC